MSDMIVEQDIELKAEDLDKYAEAAACVVEELRDFLSQHYAEITNATHTPNARGSSLTMPAAYEAPEYAGEIHRLKMARDNFCNAARGN
jgi:hypothetical protein